MNKPLKQLELIPADPVVEKYIEKAIAEAGADVFDWSADDLIVVRPRPGVAIYRNKFDHIVIRTQNTSGYLRRLCVRDRGRFAGGHQGAQGMSAVSGAAQLPLFPTAERPGIATYPHRPGFKSFGASQEAGQRIAGEASRLRAQVLAELRKWPAGRTADEIALLLRRDRLSVRPRFSELPGARRDRPYRRASPERERHVRRRVGDRMTRTNWARHNLRDRMRRYGTELAKDDPLVMRPMLRRKPRKRQLSKDELREQAAAAFLAWRERQGHQPQ